MKFRRWIIIAAAVALLGGLVIVAGRRNQAKPTAVAVNKLRVAASFYPMAEFARQVGGDRVNVTTIVPPSSEPHDYEPTPKEYAELGRSALFVYNGANMELWAERLSPPTGTRFLEASKGIDLLQADGGNNITPDGPVYNPHVWLDPVLAQKEVGNILAALQKADPANTAYYIDRATNFIQKLKELDKAFKDGLTECQNRYVIASHDILGYVANRYGFTVQSISGLSPDDEPTPQKLAELTQYAKDHHVQYIFYEDLVSPKLSETIAKEAGVKTLVFSPIEGLGKDESAAGKNYLTMQEQNLQNLRTALVCK